MIIRSGAVVIIRKCTFLLHDCCINVAEIVTHHRSRLGQTCVLVSLIKFTCTQQEQ